MARPAPDTSHFMKESDHQNQDAPLSYRGTRHIVGLVFLLVMAWLVLRSLQPVVLLFAIVFLLAMVLNPIVVWLQKHHVPRLASVILLMRAKRSYSGRARQRDAIVPGQHLILHTCDRDDVRASRGGSCRACGRAFPDCHRRILFVTAQARLRCDRSRSSGCNRREELTLALR